MMDAAFTDWSDYFFKISTILGMAYWQGKAIHLTMLSASNKLANYDLDKKQQETIDRVNKNIPLAKANMKAALEAMRQLSEQHGFKFADALHLADIDQYEVDELESVDAHQARLDYFMTELGGAAPASY